MGVARTLYRDEPFGVDLADSVYVLDAITIDLCLSVFPWAPFRSTKAAVKLHTLLDLRGNIPSFLHISDGKMHEVNILDQLLPEPGAFYIMDRGYLDFKRLHRIHKAGSFFVTRGKSNLKIERRYSHPVDRSTGLICDQTVVLTVFYSQKGFPEPLRRIRFKDPESGRTLIFLTNNFTLPALTITQLYRCRWQVELFFKWIKQHLRIKAFFGTSENAVKSQSWIAVSVYVLVANVKKRLKIAASLYEMLQILSLTMFGSAQEFVRVCILCGFLESDEFGLSGSQALRLQQQIVHVSITAAAAEQSFDVAVDGFHHSHRYLRPAIVQNTLEMIQQHLG